MEPATSIIERLGGVTKVAQLVGVHRTRVSNWKRAKRSGGTDGRVPQDYHLTLLAYAQQIGIPLAAADFLPVSITASAPSVSACDSATATSGATR